MIGNRTPFLSIIVPFHNSAEHCTPLLQTLSRVRREDDVELILVDDGSSDGTVGVLREFARSSNAPVLIIERTNGGPGAARNSGLVRASGEFIWFVDSDDDIDLKAIAIGRSSNWSAVDLVAWDWDHPTIARNVSPGLYDCSSALPPPDVFDPIVANWYSMALLTRSKLRFPEYCIFEATPIEAFVLPLLVSSYVVAEFTAYKANTSSPSVTRGGGKSEARFFDRLATVSLGRAFVRQAQLDRAALARFDEAFVRLFLWYSIRLSKRPDHSWLLALRVMRKFRDEARRFDICDDPFLFYGGGRASRSVMRLLWRISAALPPQDSYFEDLHMSAWGRKLAWAPPIMRRDCATLAPPAEAFEGSYLSAPARP